MTHWNYRIVRETYADDNGVGYGFGIAEVHYNEDDEPVAYAFTKPFGETEQELTDDWNAMADAFNEPILIEEDFAAPTEEEIDEFIGGDE